VANTNTLVVKVRDVYEEIAIFILREQRWFRKVLDSDFYAFEHPGLAWPIDRAFFETVLHHLSDGQEFYFQHRTGQPFIRNDFAGFEHLGPNIEARALSQRKARQSGIWKSGGERNKLFLRVPHR